MELRGYQSSDLEELAALFYHTVHTVNRKDYTQEQLDAWATGQVDLDGWDRSLREHITVIAVDGGRITGFGDMDRTGFLDRLYVHADYQGRGIATAICDQLEQAVGANIITHASITARCFFEQRGYRIIRRQEVERHGVLLTNFVMEKKR